MTMKPMTTLGKTAGSAALLLAFVFAGCGNTLPATQEQPQGAVLGHLQSRDRKVTFYAGPADDGPRFTIRDRDGQVIAAGLTTNELKVREPDLFHIYQSSMAKNMGKGTLDASLQLPVRSDNESPR